MIRRVVPCLLAAGLLSGCIAIEVPAARLGCDTDPIGTWRSGGLSQVIGGSENDSIAVDDMLPGGRLGAWTVALEAGADVDTVLASLPPMRARDAIALHRAAPATTSTSGAKP